MEGIKEGTKSGLFDMFNLAIDTIRPDYLVIENVKNLLSKKMEKDFNHVKRSLKELGYRLKTFTVDSSEFGTPQQRVRVIIFGVHRTVEIRKDHIVHGFQRIQNRKADPIRWPFSKGLKVISWSKSHRTKIIKDSYGDELGREKHIDLRIKQGGLVNTLTTGDGCRGASTGTMVVEQSNTGRRVRQSEEKRTSLGRVRLLNNNECEALMMYEKDHTKYGMYKGVKKEVPKTARYKMCGNGVVATCVSPFKDLILEFEKVREPDKAKYVTSIDQL